MDNFLFVNINNQNSDVSYNLNSLLKSGHLQDIKKQIRQYRKRGNKYLRSTKLGRIGVPWSALERELHMLMKGEKVLNIKNLRSLFILLENYSKVVNKSNGNNENKKNFLTTIINNLKKYFNNTNLYLDIFGNINEDSPNCLYNFSPIVTEESKQKCMDIITLVEKGKEEYNPNIFFYNIGNFKMNEKRIYNHLINRIPIWIGSNDYFNDLNSNIISSDELEHKKENLKRIGPISYCIVGKIKNDINDNIYLINAFAPNFESVGGNFDIDAENYFGKLGQILEPVLSEHIESMYRCIFESALYNKGNAKDIEIRCSPIGLGAYLMGIADPKKKTKN